MGTPDFALPTLRALCESEHEIVGVVTKIDTPSETACDSHTPFKSQIIGNTSTQMAWKIKVRKKDKNSEIVPLPSAVKNAEPKILIPQNK